MKSEPNKKSNSKDNISSVGDDSASERRDDPEHNQPSRKAGWFKRLTGFFPVFGELLIAGVLAGILDKASDYASSHNLEKISGVLKFLSLVSLLALIPLIVIKFTEKIRLVWGLFSGAVVLLGISLLLIESYSRPGPKPFLVVSPARLQLANNRETIRTSVLVRNSHDQPVYGVTLRIEVDRPGIPAGSLVVESDDAPKEQLAFRDNPVNSLRMDALSSTKTGSDIVYFTLGFIAPKSYRELRIGGSIITNSWADLSISEYQENLVLSGWSSNFTMIDMPHSIWKDAPKGIKLTSLPLGAIIFTNGMVAFTNLPHLALALDTPDIGGSNQFNLTDKLILKTGSQMHPSEITGLLLIPDDGKTDNKHSFKPWLVNSSLISVTNIEVIFTAMFGLRFETNESWNASSSPQFTNNPIMARIETAPANMSVKIPPISVHTDGQLGAVGFCINAKDVSPQMGAFWLTFLPTNMLSKPTIVRVVPSVIADSNGIAISIEFPGTARPK
jgi:hypothetical protein